MGFAITPITGKQGRFQCNVGIISVEDENIELARDRIEATGTEDQRADGSTPQNLTTGIRSAKGSIQAGVNADQLVAGVLGIADGDVITNVKFYLDKNAAGSCVTISHMLVLSIRYQGRIKDKWMYTLTVESTAGFNCVITQPTT